MDEMTRLILIEMSLNFYTISINNPTFSSELSMWAEEGQQKCMMGIIMAHILELWGIVKLILCLNLKFKTKLKLEEEIESYRGCFLLLSVK